MKKLLYFLILAFVLAGSCVIKVGSDNKIDVYVDAKVQTDLRSKYGSFVCINEYINNYATQTTSYPRTVYLNPDNMSERQIKAATIVMNDYNSKFNYTLFNPVVSNQPINRTDCNAIFMHSGEIENSYIGLAKWNKCSAEITIVKDNVMPVLYKHELGHALNLMHENDSKSFMYETINNSQDYSDLTTCLINLSIQDAKEQKNNASNNTNTPVTTTKNTGTVSPLQVLPDMVWSVDETDTCQEE